jgi:hypothetical protein
MKREKRLTKRERKDQRGSPQPAPAAGQHLHCVACGRHLDSSEFSASPPAAAWLRCAHRTRFAACMRCVAEARRLLAEHDRTGQPVHAATAWH